MKLSLSILASAILLLVSAPAIAQPDGDKARAQELLREGNTLLAQKQYAGALGKFEAAYEAYPSPALLLNIGTSLRALGRHADAANTYARWIQARTNPQRLAEVEEVLSELDKKVARVSLTVSEPGAEVAVDGRALPSGLTVIRLEPGSHTITAKKAGFTEARKEIRTRAGEAISVELELTSESAVEPEGPEPDPTTPDTAAATAEPDPDISASSSGESSGTVLKIAGLSTAAVGLIAVGVGVKFGLDAKSINDDLEAVDSSQGWTPELLAKQDEGESAETKFIAFTAIGGAAIIAGGVMSYFGFFGGDSGEDSLALVPSVSSDSAGWAITGRL